MEPERRRADHEVYLSVVIPAFNEVSRIGDTVTTVCSYLDPWPDQWELIVVLDGKSAGAREKIASATGARPNVMVLDNQRNRGKGYSVRRGMIAARGRFRLFIDADLSLPIEGTPTLLDVLRQDADIAIGSRVVKGARVSGHPARFRQVMGRMFNLLVRFLAVPGVRDTQCGFKAFRAEAAVRSLRRVA